MLNFTHGARSQHSNGLAERMVAVVEEILRTRINYKQDDWESDSGVAVRAQYYDKGDLAREISYGNRIGIPAAHTVGYGFGNFATQI